MFYSDGYQRRINKTTFGKANLPNTEIQRQGRAFQDSFRRTGNEYGQLQSRQDLINSYLDIPKVLEIDLGKATLAKLLNVKVPDKDDKSWLNEKQRLINMYKNQNKTDSEIKELLKQSPPLGRQQYTKDEQTSLASANISSKKKIDELMQEVKAGRTSSDAQMANMIIQLSAILKKANDLDKLVQTPSMQGVIGAIPTGISAKSLGIDLRLLDIEDVKKSSGRIALLILKQAMDAKSPHVDKPVIAQKKINDPRDLEHIKLTTLFGAKSDAPYFLDLNADGEGTIAWRHKGFLPIILKQLQAMGADIQSMASASLLT